MPSSFQFSNKLDLFLSVTSKYLNFSTSNLIFCSVFGNAYSVSENLRVSAVLLTVVTVSRSCSCYPQDLEQVKQAEREAISRVPVLETRLAEREQDMEVLLNSSHEQRAKTVEGFESLLASERAAKIEASQRAESLSLQLQTLQGELDVLQAQLTTVRNHDSALETRVRAFADSPQGYSPAVPSRSKRPYQEAGAVLTPMQYFHSCPYKRNSACFDKVDRN